MREAIHRFSEKEKDHLSKELSRLFEVHQKMQKLQQGFEVLKEQEQDIQERIFSFIRLFTEKENFEIDTQEWAIFLKEEDDAGSKRVSGIRPENMDSEEEASAVSSGDSRDASGAEAEEG